MRKVNIYFRSFLIVAIFLISISSSGCSASDIKAKKSGASDENSILERTLNIDEDELEQKIENEETFILELSKQNCPYCNDFECECLGISTEEPVPYFRLSIDDLDVKEIEKKLSINIDAVPIVAWIQNGSVDNLFPIDYPYNFFLSIIHTIGKNSFQNGLKTIFPISTQTGRIHNE